MKIVYEFESEFEMEEWVVNSRNYKNAYSALLSLQQEMRSLNKHEEPTERDAHWYKRLLDLMSEYEVE